MGTQWAITIKITTVGRGLHMAEEEVCEGQFCAPARVSQSQRVGTKRCDLKPRSRFPLCALNTGQNFFLLVPSS